MVSECGVPEDRYQGSFRSAWREHWRLYAGLAATWAVVAAILVAGARSETVGFSHEISWIDYLRTQAGVIVHYLRLCVRPVGLVISYEDWPVARAA